MYAQFRGKMPAVQDKDGGQGCKPDFVRGVSKERPTPSGDHSSGIRLAANLKRPTRGLFRLTPPHEAEERQENSRFLGPASQAIAGPRNDKSAR